ncbi:hypothetical protein C8T65DRAFT_37155 [Cerioporus squamosus]|nr:hypothetical protein C8T65DRAFT_37155 [Cerioporus squamosus]
MAPRERQRETVDFCMFVRKGADTSRAWVGYVSDISSCTGRRQIRELGREGRRARREGESETVCDL